LALKGLKIITILGFSITQKNYSEPVGFLETKYKHKLGLAAGLDKNGDYIDALAAVGFSFLEIGTVTPKSQKGNSKPRLLRLTKEKALVNRMGFNNKGVDYLVSKVKKSNSGIPLGISIGKNFDTTNELAHEDYLCCLSKVYEFATYVAINISSPNTKNLRDLESKESLNFLLNKLKKRQEELSSTYGYKPLLVKISPDNSKEALLGICQSLLDNNIDGVICSNTTTNHDYFSGTGGLSGQPLFDASTLALRTLRKHLGSDFPIIASGGVMNKKSFDEKINSGADLVQIYTGFIYKGPSLIAEIINPKN